MSLLVTQLSFTLHEADYEVKEDGHIKIKHDEVFKEFATKNCQILVFDVLEYCAEGEVLVRHIIKLDTRL